MGRVSLPSARSRRRMTNSWCRLVIREWGSPGSRPIKSSIPSLLRNLTAPGWGFASADPSWNHMAAVCGLPTTLRVAQVFISPFPPNSRHMNNPCMVHDPSLRAAIQGLLGVIRQFRDQSVMAEMFGFLERAHKRTKVVIALGILVACCSRASALDPSLDISQYAHTAWKIREGFSKGRVTSIAQTPDGYLWLGTEFGLLRFDGVRNVLWDQTAGERLPSRYIRNLLTAHDGRLWIGTYKGLASWKDGKLTAYPELAGQTVDALVEDREGTVWAGGYRGSIGKLCAIQSGSAQCYGDDGRLGLWVASLYEDRRGNLWAGAQTGLWRWKPGPPKLYPMTYAVIGTSSQILNESAEGALLIATQDGIRKLVDGNAEAYSLPGTGLRFQAARLLWDRNGGLWIGTPDRGL